MPDTQLTTREADAPLSPEAGVTLVEQPLPADRDHALADIYRVMRPGEPTTAEAAVFKTEPSQSKSVAAKIRFRMKPAQ